MTHATPRSIAAAGLLLLTAGAAPAAAHVTVNPSSLPAGSETELLVRVPSEEERARTTKIAVKLPPGFITVSTEQVPGWKVTLKTSKLAKPVQTDDGPVTQQVDEIQWTGDGSSAGSIAPEQYRDFPISVAVPGKAGDTLTFKAVQTYSDGSIVRWIGAPSDEEPAPTLTLTSASDAGHHGAGGHADDGHGGARNASTANDANAASSGGASKGLAFAGLLVGGLGLLTGGAALARTRRTA